MAVIFTAVLAFLCCVVLQAAGPPDDVKATVISSRNVVVTWTQSPSPEATGYRISYTTTASYISVSSRSGDMTVNDPSTTSYTFTGLENTPYTITVQTRTNTGFSGNSDVVSVTTWTDAPSSPPQNVMVTSVNPSSLRVSWDPPIEIDRNGPLTGHVIQYYRVGSNNMISETVPSATALTISGLVPFVDYSVRVAAMTVNGSGTFSDSETQTSGQNSPTVPRPLNVDSVTDSTITLSWMTPDPTNGIITQYQLQYRRCGGSYILLQPFSTEVTRTVTGLVVNTDYCFRVRAYTVISLGPSDWTGVVRGRTYGPPTNVNAVTLSPRSIEVTWDPPVVNVDDVDGYIISYDGVEDFANDDSVSISRLLTMATINGLEEFVSYGIIVRAVYNAINVPTTSAVRMRTWSDVPDGPPHDIRLMDTGPAMLSVRYIPPEPILRNGDVTGYVIRYTRVGSGVSQMITVGGGSTNGLRTSVIPGLMAFTNYSVQVAAFNVNGTGPFSDVVYGVSRQDTPHQKKEWHQKYEAIILPKKGPATAPRSLTVDIVRSTSVTLSWMPPDTPNGIIIQYEVQYSVNSTTSLVNFTDTLMGTVEQLLPGTIYTLQIRAYTRVGAGPFSGMITLMTLPPPPEPVSDVSVPTQSISSSMITIDWMEPNTSNGDITHYTVFYLPVSDLCDANMTSNGRKRQLAQDGEFAMNFTETSGTLTNLNGSVTYRIQVSAIAVYNGTELVGDRSSAEFIATLEGAPSVPQSLVGVYMTNTSIFLSWKRPDPPHGQIINYTISYTSETYDDDDDDDDDAGILTNSTIISAASDATLYYLLTGLRPGTQYQISVIASTSVGLGPAAEVTAMTSSNNVPCSMFETSNDDCGGVIAGFSTALVIALVVVVISVVLNVILFAKLRKKTSFTPPKYPGQSYHEMKESGTLKDSTLTMHHLTQKMPEPTYDLIDSGQKSHDNIKMTTNPAYDISTTVKMEDNPAYSLSGNKAVESDYM